MTPASTRQDSIDRTTGDRSRVRRARLICWVSALISGSLVVTFHWAAWHGAWNIATAFFAAVSFMVVVTLTLAANARSFRDLPIAKGKVVALIPSYNEDAKTVHACIRSLLAGTRVPDVIHVIDDGSVTPVARFDHPRVVWHRIEHSGKRAAQIHGLDRALDADFVLTVDSDSIVDKHALAEILRAVSLPDVQAATGTCLVRNRSQNWLTRLTDLEFVSGNFVMRKARSCLGAVAPTSGPFAIYRAAVVIDNREDYLTSGTYGDDRRLTHYALMRGRVVACDTSIVEMEMPATLPTMYRQRVRWSKGYMKYLPWELANLNGAALALRVWNLMLIAVMPVVLVAAFVVVPIADHTFFWTAWVYWCALLYSQTLAYAIGRPRVSARERWLTWLVGTPFLIILQFVVLRPALYSAAFKVRNNEWGTRELA